MSFGLIKRTLPWMERLLDEENLIYEQIIEVINLDESEQISMALKLNIL